MNAGTARIVSTATFLVLVLGIILLLNSVPGPLPARGNQGMLFTFMLAGILISAVAMFHVWRSTVMVYSNSALINRQTGDVEGHADRTKVVWDKDSNLKIISLENVECRLSMAVAPISANPKVKNIIYSVRVKALLSSATLFEKFWGFLTKTMGYEVGSATNLYYLVDRVIQYHLYEFNDACGRELSKLSNPLNPQQQKQFFELVSEFLREKLRPLGISIEHASFQFAD
ncbi:MAG: hypothetical protein WCT08_04990 [Patescibacteria group bacterium]|jgi:hypothetical protein